MASTGDLPFLARSIISVLRPFIKFAEMPSLKRKSKLDDTSDVDTYSLCDFTMSLMNSVFLATFSMVSSSILESFALVISSAVALVLKSLTAACFACSSFSAYTCSASLSALILAKTFRLSSDAFFLSACIFKFAAFFCLLIFDRLLFSFDTRAAASLAFLAALARCALAESI